MRLYALRVCLSVCVFVKFISDECVCVCIEKCKFLLCVSLCV